MKKICLFLALLSVSFGSRALANTVSVDTDTVITTDIQKKLGINVNAGIDKDTNRPAGARPLHEAISDIGAKVIRYPGGKKSLYYSWASAPYTDPTTNYWVPGWYNDAAMDTMNFDEFMTLCQQVGAAPHINVAYNPGAGLGSALAAEWVRYANVTKGYGVKYWEIGNEMWQSDLGFTVDTLAAVVIDYSTAMKAVDPTIKIGVSWNQGQAQTLINLCGGALDFFNISNYAWYGGSFEAYRTTPNKDLNFVQQGISLKTIISEYNTNFWDGTPENALNATAKGLIVFDMAGQFLKDPKCEYACFWNTRWYSMAGTTTDGFGNQNELLPNAQPLTFYRKYLHNTMVSATSSLGDVVSYASYNTSTKDLTVFLVNKQTADRTISINISSINDYTGSADMDRYAGTGYFDTAPTIGPAGSVTVTGNMISDLALPATSITAIRLPHITEQTVSVEATDADASEQGPDTGTWTISRAGSTGAPLTVNFSLNGTAALGDDYTAMATASVTIPSGQNSVTVVLTPIDDSILGEGSETAILQLASSPSYTIDTASATITIADNDNNLPTVNAGPNQTVPLASSPYSPGLWYGTVPSGNDFTTPNPQTLLITDVGSYTEDGIAVSTTEIYTGQIYDADGQISFTENIDDRARIWIDGTLVINDSNWNTRSSTGNLNLTPGWHAIEIRISNGTGSGGPASGIGVGYDPDGGTAWQTLADPGDGSFLRVDEIRDAATAILDGIVDDPDGLPKAITWSKVSGPSPVIFNNPSEVNTTATFTAEGVYILRLTADDGFDPVYDECVITVGTGDGPIVDVELPAGISLYGYTGQNPIDAQDAFQTLITNNQLSLVRWVNPANGQIKELYYTTFPSPGWVNEIGNLTLGQGYVVKTTAACTLSISGNKSTASITMDIPAGYSIIGYNKETPMNAQTAFQELITAGKLELVRWVEPTSGTIKELYYTTLPSAGWVNEINNLTEGQGYIIKLNAPHEGFSLP